MTDKEREDMILRLWDEIGMLLDNSAKYAFFLGARMALMTREELGSRVSAQEILDGINRNGVNGEEFLESCMNMEWWRGFYAGIADERETNAKTA